MDTLSWEDAAMESEAVEFIGESTREERAAQREDSGTLQSVQLDTDQAMYVRK